MKIVEVEEGWPFGRVEIQTTFAELEVVALKDESLIYLS